MLNEKYKKWYHQLLYQNNMLKILDLREYNGLLNKSASCNFPSTWKHIKHYSTDLVIIRFTYVNVFNQSFCSWSERSHHTTWKKKNLNTSENRHAMKSRVEENMSLVLLLRILCFGQVVGHAWYVASAPQ